MLLFNVASFFVSYVFGLFQCYNFLCIFCHLFLYFHNITPKYTNTHTHTKKKPVSAVQSVLFFLPPFFVFLHPVFFFVSYIILIFFWWKWQHNHATQKTSKKKIRITVRHWWMSRFKVSFSWATFFKFFILFSVHFFNIKTNHKIKSKTNFWNTDLS